MQGYFFQTSFQAGQLIYRLGEVFQPLSPNFVGPCQMAAYLNGFKMAFFFVSKQSVLNEVEHALWISMLIGHGENQKYLEADCCGWPDRNAGSSSEHRDVWWWEAEKSNAFRNVHMFCAREESAICSSASTCLLIPCSSTCSCCRALAVHGDGGHLLSRQGWRTSRVLMQVEKVQRCPASSCVFAAVLWKKGMDVQVVPWHV